MSETKFKPVTVEKQTPVVFDLGNLATFDLNPVDEKLLKENKEKYLTELNRDNTQLMINQILQLPIKTTVDSTSTSNGQDANLTLVQLPVPTTDLPREKSLPKAKPLTKWQQFALKKGIQKTKKYDKKMFDEEKGEWVNKWGFKGKNKELDSQWLVEVDDKHTGTDNELVNPRTLARADRKKLVKKNLAQQKKNLRNAAA